MTNLANVFGDMLADVATRATNQALQTDPQLRARLQQLDGNTIEINCTMPPMAWHLTVLDGGLHLGSGPALQPQVIMQGSAADLAAWLFPGNQGGRVEINGDETLLLEVAGILRDFQPDIQDPLGQLLGPQMASTLLGTAEMGLKGLRSLIEGVGRGSPNTGGSGPVQQEQLDTVLHGIDELRLRVDRLAAQVKETSADPGQSKPGGTDTPGSGKPGDA